MNLLSDDSASHWIYEYDFKVLKLNELVVQPMEFSLDVSGSYLESDCLIDLSGQEPSKTGKQSSWLTWTLHNHLPRKTIEDLLGSRTMFMSMFNKGNGRKSLTTVAGLNQKFKFEKILKDVKEFCCNGNVVEDKDLGKILQLQGDQRNNLSTFLVNGGIVAKDRLKIHGVLVS